MEESSMEETPLLLMRMALGLLDKSGEGAVITACHLQAAIDAAIGDVPTHEGDGEDETGS